VPVEAQLSPIHSIIPADYNHDGKTDLIVAGNYYDVLPEIGRYDAMKGLLLQNVNGDFVARIPSETGFWAEDQVRVMKQLRQGQLIIGKNNAKVQVYKPVKK